MDDRLHPDTIINTFLSRRLRPVPVSRWSQWLYSSVVRLRDLIRKPSREEQTRLRQFIHHNANIDCLQCLGGGADGVVVLALIEGKRYVLKVFNKWKPPGPKRYPKEQSIYLSPFVNESRCFGLLDSRHMNNTWAVCCHGWMLLTHSQYDQIHKVVDISCCTRWVIVKEYLPVRTNRSYIDTIVNNFRIPREARILPEDMEPENYSGSQVVDLGRVLTEPHPEWSEFEFDWFFKKTLRGIEDWDFDDQALYTSPDVVASSSSRFNTFRRFNVSFYPCLCAFLLPSLTVYLRRNRAASVGCLRALTRGFGCWWSGLS